MKYVIVIPDGAADAPLEELGGKTPLEAAALPNVTRLARTGRVGRVVTTPAGFEPASDVCTMTLLGADPHQHYSGRAALEALAQGVSVGEKDVLYRVNLVTTRRDDDRAGGPEVMVNPAVTGLSEAEGRRIFEDVLRYWREQAPSLASGVSLTATAPFRAVLVDGSGREHRGVSTSPPHGLVGQPIEPALPQGGLGEEGAGLRKLMQLSQSLLTTHEVNLAREAQGLTRVSQVWIWGQSKPPVVPPFAERFKVRGALISGTDLVVGVGRALGIETLAGAGPMDFDVTGRAAVAAVDSHDLVICHVQSPDEAAHAGDCAAKVAVLEAIDRHIVGPLMEKLREFGDPEQDEAAEGWRMMVAPDHATSTATRAHTADAVPFAMAGAWVRSVVERAWTEEAGASSDLAIDPGHELMEYFLHGGLAGVRLRAAPRRSRGTVDA